MAVTGGDSWIGDILALTVKVSFPTREDIILKEKVSVHEYGGDWPRGFCPFMI
jgi:hypothetical protein